MPAKRVDHDCGSEEPFRPSNAHYLWHRKYETPACPRSLEEKSFYQYKWRYGTTVGWNGMGKENNPPFTKNIEGKVVVVQDKPKPRPPITRIKEKWQHKYMTLGEVMPDLGKERFGEGGSYADLYQKERKGF